MTKRKSDYFNATNKKNKITASQDEPTTPVKSKNEIEEEYECPPTVPIKEVEKWLKENKSWSKISKKKLSFSDGVDNDNSSIDVTEELPEDELSADLTGDSN